MSDTDSREIRTYLTYILLVVGLVTLVGTVGFNYFESGHNANIKSPFDSLWWALVTITTIGYGDIYPVTTGGRIFALFLMFTGIGTLSISTAGIAAYLVRFNQIEQLRTWNLKGHVVIGGLGTMGFLLATAFLREGYRVLVIERDESNERIAACRGAGAVVLIGNAAAPDTLRRAKLQRAKHLVIVCGQDSHNAEVAAHVDEVVADRDDKLGCSVHVVDPDLWHLLRSWDLATAKRFRIEFFNVFDVGARALLALVPPFDDPASPAEASSPGAIVARAAAPHLLIVGATGLAQNLIVQAVRDWRERAGLNAPRLRVTLVDEETAGTHAALRQRYPGLDRVTEFVTHSVSVRSSEFHQARFLYAHDGSRDVSRVYVCLDDEARALSAALVLLNRLRGSSIPVAVRMNQDRGLARLLRAMKSRPGFENLHVFELLEHACQPDLVMGGANEILARALHGEYLRSQRALGVDLRANAAAVPWEALPLDMKELNRNQADDISTKLDAVGYRLGPLLDMEAPPVTFTAEEVETMAALEHERWFNERRALGWTLGPRDPVKKTNPNLVPWDQLGEDTRALNRELVRQLPGFLARIGLTVHRIAT